MKKYLGAADILLPDFDKIDGQRWAVVACDQYTSEPQYWEGAAAAASDSPSTLKIILPEVYPSERRTQKYLQWSLGGTYQSVPVDQN